MEAILAPGMPFSSFFRDVQKQYNLPDSKLTELVQKYGGFNLSKFEYSSQPLISPQPTAKPQSPIDKFLASTEAPTIEKYVSEAITNGKMSKEGEAVIVRFLNCLGARGDEGEATTMFMGFQGAYMEKLGKLGYGTLLIKGKAKLLHESSIVEPADSAASDPNAAKKSPDTSQTATLNSTPDQNSNSATSTNINNSGTTSYTANPTAASTTAQPAVLPKAEGYKNNEVPDVINKDLGAAEKGAKALGNAVSNLQSTGGRANIANGSPGWINSLGNLISGPKMEGELGERRTKDFEKYLAEKGFYRTIDDMNEILKDRNPKDHWQKGEQNLKTILSGYQKENDLNESEMSELVKAYKLAPRFHLAGSPEVGIPYPLEYRAWSFKGDDLRSEFRDACREKITQAVSELKNDPFNRGKIETKKM